MSIPGSANPLLLKQAAAGGFQIERSLRFNSSDSAYLSRTPSTAGNRKTWTWAGWVKRSGLTSSRNFLFGCGPDGNDFFGVEFSNSSDALIIQHYAGGTQYLAVTTQVFRDASAWFHLAIALDTTQATNTDRVKAYVNGERVTAFSTYSTWPQNLDANFNRAATTLIGRLTTDLSFYFSGYLADIHFIDGQALTPSSFTEVSATTGQLVPIPYTGTYGTNGFRLKFADNSNNTATTLGADTSGNGNNWTPNNLSVTAGSGNDSLVDTPTSYGTDTGAGGEVRGNYATLNPLLPTLTPTNGNLDTPNSTGQNYSTIAVSTGKWYVESTVGPITPSTFCGLGVHFNPSAEAGAGYYDSGAYIGLLYSTVLSRYEGVNSAADTAVSASSGDILAIRLDLDSGTQTIAYYLNNTLITSSNLPSGKTWFITTRQNNNQSLNFGQRAFAYTAPSGFKALCDTNLPAPVVAKPNEVMDVATWSGTGATNSITFASGLSPDFVWIKARNAVAHHVAFDIIRGANKAIYPSLTNAEDTYTATLNSFDSSGFTLGYDDWSGVNQSGRTYVGWAWDAGSSTVTNTQGSITSQVRANASAGFSIVTYTAPASNTFTVGHGLGVAPGFILVKGRNQAYNWDVYHQSLGATGRLILNTTSAFITTSGPWANTPPTSSVFSSSGNGVYYNNGDTLVAYCFAPVAGYSSFGSYTGNGSTNGPFVYTGFRPRWIMLKRTDSGQLTAWQIIDTKRDGYNVQNNTLFPNLADSEFTNTAYLNDILSNGFKLRTSLDNGSNASGGTYIYAAFAEHPFAYARAR